MKRLLPLILSCLAVSIHVSAQGSAFWGYLSQSSEWDTQTGVYSYQTTPPFDKTSLFTSGDCFFNAGCAWQNGYYYGMYYSAGGWFSEPSATLYKINTDTWTAEGDPVNLTLPDQINFVAIETAQATDGTTWGEFRTADENTYELGTVDYTHMTRTSLSTTTRYYLALGIARDGFLYGVDTNGDLYRISTSTGEETLVGHTGIKIGGEYTDPKAIATSGEIDPASDEFYWPYYSGVYGDSVYMYKIDLKTAAATKLGALPSGDQIIGMIFPVVRAPEGAPAPASGIAFHFTDASLSGQVTFTAPDTTASGQPLDAPLSYQLETTDTVYKGTVTPGATVSVDVAAKTSGLLGVKITLSNVKGTSLPASASHWVGYDVPASPSAIQATLSADTVATVSWKTPAQGVHGGFLGEMTYDVCRVVDDQSVTLATAIGATSLTDTLRFEGNKKVCYGVRAHNGSLVGAYGYSNTLTAGAPYQVPFEDRFDENTKRDFYTTIDANHDGITIFRHYSPAEWGGLIPEQDYHEMGYNASTAKQKADDWFVSPKIHLDAGVIYKFAVDAHSSSSLNSDKQVMEVMIGADTTVAAMSHSIMTPVTVSNHEPKTLMKEFSVDESGTYHLGIHVLTDPGMESLYFTNILVAVATDPEAPDSVRQLSVVPDPEGLLKATVSFEAPTVTNSGRTLSSLSKIEILRNGEVIATETAVAPGQSVTYVDETPANGYSNYTVVAYNDKGNGRRAERDSVYVGVDVPLPPTGFAISDKGQGFVFSWNQVSAVGANGRVVRPQDVRYRLWLLDESYNNREEIKDTTGLGAAYAISTDEGVQDLIRFGVVAYNVAGESRAAYVRTLTGAPYTLPFAESFATGVSHGLSWMEGDGDFAITTAESSDQDAGCVAYTPDHDAETASFNLGKMSLLTATHPRLSFAYHHLASTDSLVVKAALPDGKTLSLDTITGSDEELGWQNTTVSLDDLAGQRYFIPKFVVTANAGHKVCLDNILIRDPYPTDLAVDLTVPDTIEAGRPAKVKVTVTNLGLTPVSDYRVDLLQGSTLLATAKASTVLQPDSAIVFELSPVIQGMDGESVLLTARLFCAKDVYDANDEATYVVYVDGTTVLGGVSFGPARPVDVYSLDGKLLRGKATSLKGLPQGVCILEGRKVQVK